MSADLTVLLPLSSDDRGLAVDPTAHDSYCKGNMEVDSFLKFCGYNNLWDMAGFQHDAPGLYRHVLLDVRTNDNACAAESCEYDLVYRADAGSVTMLPQIVNVTAADDFSKRYFYEARSAGGELRQPISIMKGYSNKLLLLMIETYSKMSIVCSPTSKSNIRSRIPSLFAAT